MKQEETLLLGLEAEKGQHVRGAELWTVSRVLWPSVQQVVHFVQGSRLPGPERWWDLPTCTPGLGPRQQVESRWGGCWNLGDASS